MPPVRMLAFFAAILASGALRAAGVPVPVTVQVQSAGGGAVEHAYVALVPAWRPSNRPLVEEIAERGVSRFRVPAGTYWLLAGASGLATSSRGPLSISGATNTMQIHLSPLESVSGTVRDEEGNPIAGARVAVMNGAIPAGLGLLSELAIRHLAPDLSATTDRKGRWTLRVADGDVPLFVEAAGRAAEWRVRQTGDAAALDVVLKEGATLRVTTDRSDPDMVVMLSHEDDGAANRPFVDEESRIWARWMTRERVTWSSLPAGVYGIYAKYPDARYFMQTATKLATVTLSASDTRTVHVTLPQSRPSSSVALFLKDLPRKAVGNAVEVFSRDGARAESFVEDAIGGSVVHIRTDALDVPWYGSTRDRFFFTRDVIIAERDAPEPATVTARADAHLRIRFAEENLQPPGTGSATIRGCGDDSLVVVPIEIEGNVARFTAPAGCRGMVLTFDPFEPIVSGTVLRPGSQGLGEFLLRGSGSAEIRVTQESDGASVEGATVRVLSVEGPDTRSIIVAEAVTDERGWAHVSGLPAQWRLIAFADSRDGARSDASPFRLDPLGRTTIDSLVVSDPASVLVDARIDPQFLERFPGAKIVSLTLRSDDPVRQAESRQARPPEGETSARFERLHAGSWRIVAMVSAAGTYSPMEVATIELEAGETQRVEKTLAPDVFEGIVTSEGVGLPARLTIEAEGMRINVNSDANGIFHAILDRPGTHRVSVARLAAQGNVIPIGNVAFDDPARRIEIAIPQGGSVTTRVRDGDRLMPGLLVWVSRRDEAGAVEWSTKRGRTTDANGDATFDDLIPGKWSFSVRDADGRRGAERQVTIDEGADLALTLDLADPATIAGTIRDLGGLPLPRARVDCAFVSSTGLPDIMGASSNADGSFAIDVIPPAPPVAFCSVVGPMGTVDAFKAVPGRPMDLVIPGATAALEISDWNARGDRDRYWLVAPDGRTVALHAVADRIGGVGTALRIPALAAGRWRLIHLESLPQLLALTTGMGNSLPQIREVNLRAGTTQTLRLESGSEFIDDGKENP